MVYHHFNFQPQACQLQQTNDVATTHTQGVQENVKFPPYSIPVCELVEKM
jgi:hypothetical protein